MTHRRFSLVFLLLLLALISGLFLAMIRAFLLTLLLAAIAAGMASPLYRRLLRRLGQRRALASAVTLVILLLVVLVPLGLLLGVVAGEAYQIAQSARPWVETRLQHPDLILDRLQGLPLLGQLTPYREQIFQKAGALVGSLGSFLFDSLQATTRGTVSFLFHLGLLLYALFFFLMDGGPLLRRILYYMPLEAEDERRMVDKFTSVTRATLKGTLLIGLAQGALAGAAFAVLGIEGAVFWGTVMTLLSVIPGIGTALVWVPAGVILLASGRVGAGVGLMLFCGLVVGSVDNLLRPRLVGRDTQMHELLILFGTLGGITLFGVLGFIVGPILAALFVTVWEIYGVAFKDWLGPVPESADAMPSPSARPEQESPAEAPEETERS
ncbi:MAG: AI-2E family transporter [Candidatus Latescibacteria bacterium]|nr:AI-2E family transporter [bacterium]MCB9512994.1 AI-2E family transporter [Candidatus Latescibacterota bacterium]MCB9516345.1 AI-2E family transporter [Candidatus Latescibacterota bacterium]